MAPRPATMPTRMARPSKRACADPALGQEEELGGPAEPARKVRPSRYFRHFTHPSLIALKATRSSRLGRKMVRISSGRYQAMKVPPS